MADKNSLSLLGCLFAGVTFGVALMAFLMVREHTQDVALDEMALAPQLVSMSAR